jgi:hypothetical protein
LPKAPSIPLQQEKNISRQMKELRRGWFYWLVEIIVALKR